MRRLAELFKTSFQNPNRRGVMSVAMLSLLVFTLITFTTLANAQAKIVTADFEDGGTGGFYGSGSTAEITTEMAHGGTHSYKITGRSANWAGPQIGLIDNIAAGEAWEFQVWVRVAAGQPKDTFNLSMANSGSSWTQINSPNNTEVTSSDWVLLKGRFPANGTLAAGATSLNLYVEAANASTNFYIDDFIAYKQEASGCSNPPDITGVSTGFETGLEGWIARPWSGVALTSSTDTAHTGSRSLLTTNRTGSWTTSAIDVTGKVCNGSQYVVDVWAKLPAGSPDVTFTLSGELTKNGANAGNPVLVPSKTVTASGWTEFRANLDWKTDYDKFIIYLQPDSDGTTNFYLDDFALNYVPAGQSVEPLPSIGAAYKPFFLVGAAVYEKDINPTDLHSQLLTSHFTSVTAENDMKWSATEPAENTFTYTKADAIVAFAKANNMAVRGHTLVWHQQTPDWVFKDANGVDMSTLPYSDANKALLQSRMKNHIQSLITHFGADVTSWDVVNEAIDETQADGFRRSKWYTIYGGPGYIDDAFKFAKEAVDAAGLTGQVKLYYNDYNTNITSKLNFIKKYVGDAKTAGVPIDGVGHQFHVRLDWPVNDDPTSIKSVTDTIDAIAALGLDNQVTELDISIYRNGATTYQSYADIVEKMSNDLVVQGYRYRDYFSAFKTLASAGKLSSVTLWGQADDHTWLTSTSKTDAPLVFDNNLHAKAAYTGIMDAQTLPNALPYAANANVDVLYNKTASITFVASDANGDTLTYAIATPPVHGTLSAITGNTVTYTAATDFSGADPFTFIVNDGKGDSNVATINVFVVAPPVVANIAKTTDLNTAASITLSATSDRPVLSYSVVTPPAHGTLSGTAPNLTYTPATDYFGADSFTYIANNGTDSLTPATVSLTVLPSSILAVAQAITVDYQIPTTITLTAKGDSITPPTFRLVANADAKAVKGTITPVADSTTCDSTARTCSSKWIYTATTTGFTDEYMALQGATDDRNLDHFTFVVNNGHDSAPAIVNVTVNAAKLYVAPVAGQATAATINKGESATFNLNVRGFQNYSAKHTAPVSFTCGGLPGWASCTVTPTTVSLDDQMTPVPFSVKITTSSSAAAAGTTSMPGSTSGTPWIPALVLATIVLMLAAMKKAKMQWRMVGASAALLVVMTLSGCGGKSTTGRNALPSGVTPAGTYTVTVTAVATHNISAVQTSDWKVIGTIPLTITVN